MGLVGRRVLLVVQARDVAARPRERSRLQPVLVVDALGEQLCDAPQAVRLWDRERHDVGRLGGRVCLGVAERVDVVVRRRARQCRAVLERFVPSRDVDRRAIGEDLGVGSDVDRYEHESAPPDDDGDGDGTRAQGQENHADQVAKENCFLPLPFSRVRSLYTSKLLSECSKPPFRSPRSHTYLYPVSLCSFSPAITSPPAILATTHFGSFAFPSPPLFPTIKLHCPSFPRPNPKLCDNFVVSVVGAFIPNNEPTSTGFSDTDTRFTFFFPRARYGGSGIRLSKIGIGKKRTTDGGTKLSLRFCAHPCCDFFFFSWIITTDPLSYSTLLSRTQTEVQYVFLRCVECIFQKVPTRYE